MGMGWMEYGNWIGGVWEWGRWGMGWGWRSIGMGMWKWGG